MYNCLLQRVKTTLLLKISDDYDGRTQDDAHFAPSACELHGLNTEFTKTCFLVPNMINRLAKNKFKGVIVTSANNFLWVVDGIACSLGLSFNPCDDLRCSTTEISTKKPAVFKISKFERS